MIRLENVLKISCIEDVLKVSWRRFLRRLEGVLKTSWRRLGKTSWRCLEDVFARRLEDVLKTSWRRLEDVWPRRIYWSWPRLLEDVLKTSSEDVRLRRTYSSWSRRLEDVFKASSENEGGRRLQDVFIITNVCWVHSLEYSDSLQQVRRNCLVLLQLFHNFLLENSFLQLNQFFLEIELYSIKMVWLFSRNVCYRLFAFRSALRSNHF